MSTQYRHLRKVSLTSSVAENYYLYTTQLGSKPAKIAQWIKDLSGISPVRSETENIEESAQDTRRLKH